MSGINNDNERISVGFNDTLAYGACKRDGVGEPGTPRGVSHRRGSREESAVHAQVYTVCTIMFNLSRALLRMV